MAIDPLTEAIAMIENHIADAEEWPGAHGVVPGLKLARNILVDLRAVTR